MKYLKTFELTKNLPEIGDYAQVYVSLISRPELKNLEEFLNRYAGRVIGYTDVLSRKGVRIEYSNIPENILIYFSDSSIVLNVDKIIAYGKNREDVTIQKIAYMYNL